MSEFTQFDYLLNSMMEAGRHDKPAEHGYGDKRKALYAYVRELERRPDPASPAAKAVEMDADKQFSQFFIDTIERVESRCMAADGPVTPTCDEITDGELRALYVAAQQVVNPSSTTER